MRNVFWDVFWLAYRASDKSSQESSIMLIDLLFMTRAKGLFRQSMRKSNEKFRIDKLMQLKLIVASLFKSVRA